MVFNRDEHARKEIQLAQDQLKRSPNDVEQKRRLVYWLVKSSQIAEARSAAGSDQDLLDIIEDHGQGRTDIHLQRRIS